jgi:hypothetical protein
MRLLRVNRTHGKMEGRSNVFGRKVLPEAEVEDDSVAPLKFCSRAIQYSQWVVQRRVLRFFLDPVRRFDNFVKNQIIRFA